MGAPQTCLPMTFQSVVPTKRMETVYSIPSDDVLLNTQCETPRWPNPHSRML